MLEKRFVVASAASNQRRYPGTCVGSRHRENLVYTVKFLTATVFPPSLMLEVVPDVNEKLLAEPDLSFQRLMLLPEL